MPLVRKPPAPSLAARPDDSGILADLCSSSVDARWAAARAAAQIPGAAAAIATALRTEPDSHVREALFSSLARAGTAQSIEEMLKFLRSDDPTFRTGALDVLRTMSGTVHGVLPGLLADSDTDVRIISCELARILPSAEASALLCDLLAVEREVNVCAAAIDVLCEVGDSAACPVLSACATRFPDAPFIGFAVKVALERINSKSKYARD